VPSHTRITSMMLPGLEVFLEFGGPQCLPSLVDVGFVVGDGVGSVVGSTVGVILDEAFDGVVFVEDGIIRVTVDGGICFTVEVAVVVSFRKWVTVVNLPGAEAESLCDAPCDDDDDDDDGDDEEKPSVCDKNPVMVNDLSGT